MKHDIFGSKPATVGDLLKPWRAFRSAITGRYVTRAYAMTHLSTTISEKRKRRPQP